MDTFRKARKTGDPYKGLVLFFSCNHCPYVHAMEEYLRALVMRWYPKGFCFVAINSNDASAYPEDSYEEMQKRVDHLHLPWGYLHDPSQKVARSFGARCTPHFFLFDEKHQFQYEGGLVDTPLQVEHAQHHYLEQALQDLFHKGKVSQPHTQPAGCSIKWMKSRDGGSCSLP